MASNILDGLNVFVPFEGVSHNGNKHVQHMDNQQERPTHKKQVQ
jgi:hypothetical protein